MLTPPSLQSIQLPPAESKLSLLPQNIDIEAGIACREEMAREVQSSEQAEEGYIDMDIGSSTFICYSPKSIEFEFHKSKDLHVRETASSPADELFYKGKLLPLHLPPRIQMVQMLLQSTANAGHEHDQNTIEPHYFTANTTPYDSCNISPSDSCEVSRELKLEDYLVHESDEPGFINPKKSWSINLKLIKQSSLRQRLKAYLRSLFTKSACSTEDAAINVQGCVNKNNPFDQVKEEKHQVGSIHRRSFSGAIKRNLGFKFPLSPSSSSSSSSFSIIGSVNGLSGSLLLRRSGSANSEVESPIQGAIAHCKQSQQ